MRKSSILAVWIILFAFCLQSVGFTLNTTSNNGQIIIEPNKQDYSAGELVRLYPLPDVGYSFKNWGGDATGNRLIHEIHINANLNITANFETWKPPIGIPAPPFGITETYRMYDNPTMRNSSLTYTQNSEGGFYTHYVDNSNPNSTNSNNPYGTVAKPRTSLPKNANVPAGSVIEIHGDNYNFGQVIYTVNGTNTQPIFIRGYSPTNKPEISGGGLFINGSYTIVENLKKSDSGIYARSFDPNGNSNGWGLAHHISIRHCEVTHCFTGMCAVCYDSGYFTKNVVFYDNYIHLDNADFDLAGNNRFPEDDECGIYFTVGSDSIWLLDNIICRAKGDGIGGGHGVNYTAKNYYVGRNIVHTCGENATDAKEVDTIIYSENIMFNFQGWSLGNGGPYAAAVVFHYGPNYSPKNVWFIYNEVCNMNGVGVQVGGDQAYDVHIIGNLIHNIHNDLGDATGYRTWSCRDIHFINNIVYDVDTGIRSRVDGSSAGGLFMYNNIIADVSPSGYSFDIGGGTHISKSILKNNLFYQPTGSIKINWGGHIYNVDEFNTNFTQVSDNIEGNPHFIDAPNNNFRLNNASAAINQGRACYSYQLFQDTYGINIKMDRDRTHRPRGTAWDIGAYEYDQDTPADTQSPTVPQTLVASPVSYNQINLTWTASTDNVGVLGYRIYRNGTSIGTSSTPNYSDTGLTSNTTYTYTVLAYDAAGNESGQSSSASATTFPNSNSSPPTVTTINATEIGISGATIHGTVNANGNSTTVSFEYGQTTSYGTTVTAIPGTVFGTSSNSVSTTLTGLNNGTAYHYRVVAVNNFGTSASTDMSFTTSNTSSTVFYITATSTTGGTISPLGKIAVEKGNNQSFTMTPSTDYLIGKVVVDGNHIGRMKNYNFVNVTKNHTIYSEFVEKYPVNITVPKSDIIDFKTWVINPYPYRINLTLTAVNQDDILVKQINIPIEGYCKKLIDQTQFNGTTYEDLNLLSQSHLLIYTEVSKYKAKMASLITKAQKNLLIVPHIAEEIDYWDTYSFISKFKDAQLSVEVTDNEKVTNEKKRTYLLNMEQYLIDVTNVAENWANIRAKYNSPYGASPNLTGFELFIKNNSDGAAVELINKKFKILYIPHIPTETDYFWTGFVFVNDSTNTAEVNFTFYSKDGIEVGTETKNIGPKSKLKGTVETLFPEENGKACFAIAKSNVRICGIEIYGTYNAGICGFSLNGDASNEGVLAKVESSEITWTGIALSNPNAEASQVKIELVSADGEVKSTSETVIEPYNRFAIILKELFPDTDFLQTDYVRYKSTTPLIAVEALGDTEFSYMIALPSEKISY